MKKIISMFLTVTLCFGLLAIPPVLAKGDNMKNQSSFLQNYDGFNETPDFGSCFQVSFDKKTITYNHIMDVYSYSLKDLPKTFLQEYKKILEENGFELKSVTEESFISYNKKTMVTINILENYNEVNVYINKRR